MLNNNSIYFNGIKGLLKADVQLNYEDWQIEEVYKCRENISYMLEKYCKIVHQHRGEVNFNLYDFQKRFIDIINKNNNILGLVPRQSGKTSAIVGYIVHYAIFNKNKNIGIIADRLQTSRKILKTIKDMFKRLPEWLKPGIEEWNKTTVILANGVKIMADATSENSLVGESISLLVVDEVAKINPNLFQDFMDSVMPTISSSPSAKIVMFSTSRGLNHWYKLVSEARTGKTDWTLFEVKWNEVPGRDENFKKKILAKYDETHWMQEYCNEFLGSSGSLISMVKLQAMPHNIPLVEKYDKKFKIYELPKKENNYFLICDYAEGIEQDYSTIHVMKQFFNKFKQVAVYKDNTIKPREFAGVKKIIGEYYNNGLVIGESNSIGQDSLNELFETYEYENIFWDLENKRTIGLKSTKKTKRLGNTYLKKFIENDKFEIVDFETINELSTYVQKGSSYEADTNCHDDLVTPLSMFSYLVNNELFVDWWVDNYEMRKNDLQIEIDDILPVFSNNHEDFEDY